MFKNNGDGTETAWTEVLTHYWRKLESETGTYSFSAYYQFENLPDVTFTDSGASGRWIQACEVKLDNVQFNAFTQANNETNTSAAANLFVNASQIGDCGNDFTVTGVLNGTDGSSYPITIN